VVGDGVAAAVGSAARSSYDTWRSCSTDVKIGVSLIGVLFPADAAFNRGGAHAASGTLPGMIVGSHEQLSLQARNVCTAWPQRGHGRSCVRWIVLS